MMIELIQLTRTEGGFELLAGYEVEPLTLGGRPHWGQVPLAQRGAQGPGLLYPRLDDWLDVHAELNSTGVFASPFSRRVGIRGAPPADVVDGG